VVSNPVSDTVIFEVKLKVKGSNEFKDKDLMVLAVPLQYVKDPGSSRPHLLPPFQIIRRLTFLTSIRLIQKI
jgi:hypothetical protein